MGVQNFPFGNLTQNARTPKTLINRGFRDQMFEKTVMRHETAIFGPQKPKSRNTSYHYFFVLFLLFQQQKHKNDLRPLFYSVLANWKTQFLHPFLEKGYF